jgi:hypothetical protein
VAFVTLTLWDSLDAIEILVGEDRERAYVPAEARELLGLGSMKGSSISRWFIDRSSRLRRSLRFRSSPIWTPAH